MTGCQRPSSHLQPKLPLATTKIFPVKRSSPGGSSRKTSICGWKHTHTPFSNREAPWLQTAASSWWIPNTNSVRSEEHTSELQSLMRISYAVFCLKKKKKHKNAKQKTLPTRK